MRLTRLLAIISLPLLSLVFTFQLIRRPTNSNRHQADSNRTSATAYAADHHPADARNRPEQWACMLGLAQKLCLRRARLQPKPSLLSEVKTACR